MTVTNTAVSLVIQGLKRKLGSGLPSKISFTIDFFTIDFQGNEKISNMETDTECCYRSSNSEAIITANSFWIEGVAVILVSLLKANQFIYDLQYTVFQK